MTRFDRCGQVGYVAIFKLDTSMNLVIARSYKYLLSAATVVVFLGCDQVKDITSGGGTKDAEPTQTSAGSISGQSSDCLLYTSDAADE